MGKAILGIFIFCFAFLIYTYKASPKPPVDFAQDYSQEQESLKDIKKQLKHDILIKDIMLSFLVYAKNQNIHLSPARAEYYAVIVLDNSLTYHVDPGLIKSVINIESGADEKAKSHKGAVGLMQVMPATGRLYHCGHNLYDPETNIECGVKILADLIQRYSEPMAIKFYLCGENKKYHKCLSSFQTEAYLSAIKREMDTI